MCHGSIIAAVLGIFLLGAAATAQDDSFIPGTGAAAPQPAVGGADKVADTLARLIEENTRLRSEIAEKQKQIDSLLARLAEDAPGGATGGVAKTDSDMKADAKAQQAAAKGPWDVRIISNEEPSDADLSIKLTDARSRMDEADHNMKQARDRQVAMEGDRVGYRSNGGEWLTKPRFTIQQLSEPRVAAQRAEAERRRSQQLVARLERQMHDSGKSRVIVGQLEDGTSVEMTAQGEAAVRISRQMQEGDRYRVSGTGSAEGGILRIKMTGAVETGGGGRPRGPVVPQPRR